MAKLSLPRLRGRENERQSGAFQKLKNVGGGALADNDDVYVYWCVSECVCVCMLGFGSARKNTRWVDGFYLTWLKPRTRALV